MRYLLVLCTLVFSQTGPPWRVDCLASPHNDGQIPVSAFSKGATSQRGILDLTVWDDEAMCWLNSVTASI